MPKQAKKTTKQVVDSLWILDNANVVHTLSYIPYLVGPVAMYFLGKTDKKKTMHHISYSAIIAVAAIISGILLAGSFLGKFIVPIYFIGSGYLAWKAYNGEEVKIDLLDTVEDKISGSVKK